MIFYKNTNGKIKYKEVVFFMNEKEEERSSC